jgi:hypothetical protein
MTTATTVAELIAALNDRSPAVRQRAAETLGELEEVQAVESLTRALKDSDADVRIHVALALGMIGDMSTTAPLTYALKDEENDAVKGALETALDMVKKKVISKKMRVFDAFRFRARAQLRKENYIFSGKERGKNVTYRLYVEVSSLRLLSFISRGERTRGSI